MERGGRKLWVEKRCHWSVKGLIGLVTYNYSCKPQGVHLDQHVGGGM